MKRLRNHYIGIDQGDEILFADFANDGPMWAGTGAREHRTPVRFSQIYRTPPAVSVSMSMWDISSAQNSRMDVKAEKIEDDGFDIVFRTWDDTRVARVRISWMSIGELQHADEWDLY